MAEFEAGGSPHRTRALSAYDQFHLLRAIGPILPAIVVLDLDAGGLALNGVAAALQGVDPAQVTQAFSACAAACERQDGETWIPATKALPLDGMLVIALAVVEANFSAYYAVKRPSFRTIGAPPLQFDPVAMPDGESWLFRPTRSTPPLIDMLALYDGRARIEHVLKANDVLDVEAENDARMRKAAERGHR